MTRILTGSAKVDEKLLQGMEESLIAADVGAGTAAEIIQVLRDRSKKEFLPEAAALLPHVPL